MPKPDELVIVCELALDERLTASQAKVFEDALRKVAAEVFPKRRVRGLWVQWAPPKGEP